MRTILMYTKPEDRHVRITHPDEMFDFTVMPTSELTISQASEIKKLIDRAQLWGYKEAQLEMRTALGLEGPQ